MQSLSICRVLLGYVLSGVLAIMDACASWADCMPNLPTDGGRVAGRNSEDGGFTARIDCSHVIDANLSTAVRETAAASSVAGSPTTPDARSTANLSHDFDLKALAKSSFVVEVWPRASWWNSIEGKC